LDQSRHTLKTGIKAATYHMLKIEKNHRYSIRVIFDA
jgi:SHS2 domain-containing protein